jgi:hypothetical protein
MKSKVTMAPEALLQFELGFAAKSSDVQVVTLGS